MARARLGPRLAFRALAMAGLAVLAPLTAASAGSLGTARGVRAVELSLMRGAVWLPLGGRALPLLEGATVRSGAGGAFLELLDGSRVDVLPFSAVRVGRSAGALELALAYGRLAFRSSARGRLTIHTSLARIEPVDVPLSGEVLVAPGRVVGLQLDRGSVEVREPAGTRHLLTAGAGPLFLPRPPPGLGPFFVAEAAPATRGARDVFGANGESLGYLLPGGRLIIRPGYVADRPAPFPTAVTQFALAHVPEADRAHATLVFDRDGEYIGYLTGPVFHLQGAAGPGSGSPSSDPDWPRRRRIAVLWGLLHTVPRGILIGHCVAGHWPCDDGEETRAGTPVGPRRP